MKKYPLILTLLGLTGLNCTTAQKNNESLSSFVQTTVDDVYKNEKVPGVFVGVLNNGQRTYFNAGFAVPDKQMPFDSATIFEIGSITKTFTAYVLMAVLMENNIAETESILKYLPDSIQHNKDLSSISFVSLMNHTSGLPRLPENINPANQMQPYEDYSADDLFAYLKTCSPKPDGKSNYSNLGAGLAGVLAASISGKTYDQLISQYTYLPFNKTLHSRVNIANKSQGHFAAGQKSDYWKMNVLAPCGGLQYSGIEMLNYLQYMCFPETDNAKLILAKLTAQTVSLNAQVAVGLGWHILNIKNRQPVYWHNGGTFGFSTFCAFAKDKSKAVIVVINQFNKNEISDGLGFKIMQKLISE
jgi:CubicO group peptidase (beta-lactamase class C family)